MPPKVRQLIYELEKAGFKNRGGKGSHRNFVHPNVSRPITVSGKLGDDPGACGTTRHRGIKVMKESARYVKIVEWSDADNCYVGSSPGLVLGGCHGDDEQRVFNELCQIVEEAIALIHSEGKPLPPATSGKDLANKIQNVA